MESPSSWVDTSLDLGIGVNRIKVEDQATTSALVEELNRVSAENKKLVEMLTVMGENYNALRSQLMEYEGQNNGASEREVSPSKKRKSPVRRDLVEANRCSAAIYNAIINGVSESSSTDQDELCKKQKEETVVKEKVSRVYYKTGNASDTGLIVKDGHHWRKYGQKVTKDNPSPRAYFKCAFAPSCPVKKKVQRSVDDQSVLVATYEGEHNHPMPQQMDTNASVSRCISVGSAPSSAANKSSLPDSTITFDLRESSKIGSSSNSEKNSNSNLRIDSPEVRKLLVEQMASSLTTDPNFTAALAAAVSGRLYQQNPAEE